VISSAGIDAAPIPASSTHFERVQSRGGPASHGADRRTCTSRAGFLAVRPSSQRRSSATVDECRVLPGGDILCGCASRHRDPRGRRWPRPHGHAEARKGLVYGFDSRTFFDEELGFAAVRGQTCDYDKPRQLPTSTPTLRAISKVACQVAITSFEESLPRGRSPEAA